MSLVNQPLDGIIPKMFNYEYNKSQNTHGKFCLKSRVVVAHWAQNLHIFIFKMQLVPKRKRYPMITWHCDWVTYSVTMPNSVNNHLLLCYGMKMKILKLESRTPSSPEPEQSMAWFKHKSCPSPTQIYLILPLFIKIYEVKI